MKQKKSTASGRIWQRCADCCLELLAPKAMLKVYQNETPDIARKSQKNPDLKQNHLEREKQKKSYSMSKFHLNC